jgi:hypothetical protein
MVLRQVKKVKHHCTQIGMHKLTTKLHLGLRQCRLQQTLIAQAVTASKGVDLNALEF